MLQNKKQLVIPMHINGLYIDDNHNYQRIDCLDSFYKYKNTPLGINMENHNDVYYDKMNKGVYLHWVLPEVMRQGIHDEKTIFPHIPNRYHVIRIIKDKGEYCVKTIIIESNALDIEGKGNVSTLVRSQDQLKYAFLGKSYEYQKNKEETTDYFDLTSLGYGDPSFSAYYAKTQNILSYYDQLNDVSVFAELWYLVVGYYENSGFEPFLNITNQEELNQLLDKFNWTLQGDVQIPIECLVEGVIRILPKNMTKGDDSLSLSIGQNIVEALSTCCGFSRDLQRLCYNHLNDSFHVDAIIRQEANIHQSQFDKGYVDDIYTIENPETVTQEQAQLLDRINLLQRGINKINHKITSLRQDGFSLWYKYHEVLTDWFLADDEKQESYDVYDKLLQDVYQKICDYELEIESIEIKLSQYKDSLKNIKLIKDEPYWITKNPTLLIQSNQSLRNYKYGFDQRQETKLQCRSRQQLLKTNQDITINGNYDVNLKDFIVEACILLDNLDILSGDYPDSTTINNHETAWQYVSLLWKISYQEDKDMSHWVLLDDDFIPHNIEPKQKTYVVDRNIISPHADNVIKSSLKKYHEIHQNHLSLDLLSNMGNIDMLSQTLGTFNEQLRSKKSTYQIPIEKFEKGFYNGDNYNQFYKLAMDVIQEQNHLSLISHNVFHYIRAGIINIEKVQLIDTFSRIRDVNVKDIKVAESINENNQIILPPRILQPARLLFEFGNQQDISSFYPIVGWIRYNYMNQSLMIYTYNGQLVGELKLIQNKLQIINKSYIEVDKELSNILLLLENHPQNFYQFLNVVEKRQKNMKECLVKEEDIAMYIGHPLALIKANITLEVQGEPIRDDCWCDGKESISGLINHDFKVRIGDERSHSDGLVGFFLNNYFYQSFESNEFMKRKEIIMHINNTYELILLMNIYLETTITTGFLPKKIISFSDDRYKNIIQSMNCSLLLGPSLQPLGGYVLPLDKLNGKEWTFNNENIETIYSEDLQKSYICEGYLKMIDK